MIKEIHDEIITQFSALTFDGSSKLFDEVQKIYGKDQVDEPGKALVGLFNGNVDIIGNTTDERPIGFELSYFEYIESTLQSELTLRYDRMSIIIEKVLDWVEKEPNNLSGLIADTTIKNIRLNDWSIFQVQTERGLAVGVTLTFNVTTVITPQLL